MIFFNRVSELPWLRNAPKRDKRNQGKKNKIKVRAYFFLRAGADVRRFLVLFFLSPLARTARAYLILDQAGHQHVGVLAVKLNQPHSPCSAGSPAWLLAWARGWGGGAI